MRVDLEHLPEDADTLKRLVRKMHHHYEQKLERHIAEIATLRERVNLLLAKRFGVSSEQIPDEQLRLFNEAEAQTQAGEAAACETDSVEVTGHRRARRGRRPLPAELPRVEVVHDLAEQDKICPHDATVLAPIGSETCEQLDVVPATVRVIRHVRLKYACRCCEQTVKTAPLPPQPIAKSLASPGLLAHVAVSKYEDALPLYRQERIWQRLGADIPRATLSHWMVRAGELVQPVVNLLREALLDQALIHCDETPVQVLKEPGKAAQSRSYMWVQVGAEPERPIILFDYDPSRGGAIPKRLLGEFNGYLHTDGYEGYQPVCQANGITQLGCFAHARRLGPASPGFFLARGCAPSGRTTRELGSS